MKLNLDALKQEIGEYLASRNFVVFHGQSRLQDSLSPVYWDCEKYPDFRLFLDAAKQCEAGLIVFHHRELTEDLIEDSLERLEESELGREEQRTIERRLRELREYTGFTCAIELSFDHEGRFYLYDLRTDWYLELLDIADEINDSLGVDEEEGGDHPLGGYFSRN